MLGLVICGGQSSRMGADKGLLKRGAKTWAQLSRNLLSELNIPVSLSINKDQLQKYNELFPLSELLLDDESISAKGPILGLLSAHLRYPGDDIFLLACDMVLMEVPVLRLLWEAYHVNREADAHFFVLDEELEPVCGIYKSKGLEKMLDIYKDLNCHNYSLKYALKDLNLDTIPIPGYAKLCLRNFNSPEELHTLQ